MSLVAGLIKFEENGNTHNAVGSFEYDLGYPKAEMLAGSDRIHGHKETPKIPYISGVVRDRDDLDLKALVTLRNATITLELANSKTILGTRMIYAGDGNPTTENAEIPVRFESDIYLEEV